MSAPNPRLIATSVNASPAHVPADKMEDVTASFPRDMRPMPLLLLRPRRHE